MDRKEQRLGAVGDELGSEGPIEARDTLALLQRLTYARGPIGQEDEVVSVCRQEMESLCDALQEDVAGNLVGTISGQTSMNALAIFAHTDEIGMIVKRVNPDGRLAVQRLGWFEVFSFGQGPVDVMGDRAIVPGVLCLGSLHGTRDNPRMWRIRPDGEDKAATLHDADVYTGHTIQELADLGVHAGTRVVVAQSRRALHEMGEFVAGYFMDNRAGIAIALKAMRLLRQQGVRPASDTYLVMTSAEEHRLQGARFAANHLPVTRALALDVAPAEAEFGIELDSRPVIVYSDFRAVYDRKDSNLLVELAQDEALGVQMAALWDYGTDAAGAIQSGGLGKAVVVAIPTANTHGFEIIHRNAILNAAKLLARYAALSPQ